MNVTPLIIPLQRRVANKLAAWQSSAKFMAIVDVMADIRPRRTAPAGFDVIITGDDRVFVVRVDRDNEDHFEYVGERAELEANLRGLADVAKLTEEEREWLLRQLDQFTHPDIVEEEGIPKT